MILKYCHFFVLMLLTGTFGYAMHYDEDSQDLDRLEFKDWPEEAKENTVIGAASRCSINAVRKYLQHIKGKFSQEGAEAALLATIDECTTHSDGPDIIKELAKKGVDLNYSHIYTPLHEAAAMANETGNLRVLRALLESGADPDKKGVQPNGEPFPLSSCQIMKLLVFHARQRTSTLVKDPVRIRDIANLLNYYSKSCREFEPGENP